MTRFLLLLILAFLWADSAMAAEGVFAVASTYTPVLGTPDFRSVFGGKDGMTLKKDSCGQLRALEFVALPGTVFRIEKELEINRQKIFRVTTDEYLYPTQSGYFIDARSVTVTTAKPAKRRKVLPSRVAILASLKSRAGTGYVWGGNVAAGLAEMTSWYPPSRTASLSSPARALWQLAGVDCSGLLYEATGGYTPRNTSALVTFGTGVSVAGKELKALTASLEPLDLIVWSGHVLIVIDGGKVIESRLVCNEPDQGVRIRTIDDALREVMKKRKPVDVFRNGGKEFVVRRWYGIPE